MITVSFVVSAAIFVAIAVRQWLPSALRIWHIMVAGAVVLLVLGEISPTQAIAAVDWNVIAYLFGVFSIGAALYDSGVSHTMGARLARAGSSNRAFLAFILAMALCAAVLTNDAAAAIGTPIALLLARARGWRPVVPLLGLCAAVTVGSMATPVGNPQNILIATAGALSSPVTTFALWLGVPALLSLAFVYLWLRRLLAEADREPDDAATLALPHDLPRTWPAWLATALLVNLVCADSLGGLLATGVRIPLGLASLIACLPVYLFGRRRRRNFLELGWPTLAFFVAMFVVTGALLQSGALQAMLGNHRAQLGEHGVTAGIAFWASQVFSNVPLVQIYLELLAERQVPNLMMLAGISTLAGNLFIISAASNVIVVQEAERFGRQPFHFWQFAWIMLPVTVVSVVLTWAWVTWLATLL
jgi:Na+/H+ antiporter NhaD/arsenite permease-like protein